MQEHLTEHNFCDHLSDCRILTKLVEHLSDDSLQKPERGRTRMEKIATACYLLSYLSRSGYPLPFTENDFVDGDEIKLLNFVYLLILIYHIQIYGGTEKPATDILLHFVNDKMRSRCIKVNNFTTAWKDGLAFTTLFYRQGDVMAPLDYTYAFAVQARAIKMAQINYDIPPLLDPEDFAYPLTERSIVTYLSMFYKYEMTQVRMILTVDRLDTFHSEQAKMLATSYNAVCSCPCQVKNKQEERSECWCIPPHIYLIVIFMFALLIVIVIWKFVFSQSVEVVTEPPKDYYE